MSNPSAIRFSKLSGSGNDFVCLDNRHGKFDAMLAEPESLSHFARTLCRRGLGVGADGIVIAGKPEIEGVADVAARFLESDGTEANLCGNGTACFIQWAKLHNIVPDGEVRILTPAGVVRGATAEDGYVRVCIPLPEDVQTNLELPVEQRTIQGDFAVIGVEHMVIYVDDIDRVDVAKLGPAIRHHKNFPQPRGVNANFVQVLGEGEIAIRTFEYGVEGETLACGTGSAAAAILCARRFQWNGEYIRGETPIEVHPPSGDTLRIYLTMDENGNVADPCLETRVRCTYTGEICGDLADNALKRDR